MKFLLYLLYMIHAIENYVSIKNDDIYTFLQEKSYTSIQGSNILFTLDTYASKDITLFLDSVFLLVNTIAIEKGYKNYYILSRKFETGETVPFVGCKDVTEELRNDIERITTFICS